MSAKYHPGEIEVHERAGVRSMAERVVEFRVQEAVEIRGAIPLRWRFEGYSPFNPA